MSAKVDFTEKKEIDLEKYLIDLSKEEKEPRPLVCIGGKPIFTRGNISCVSGKAKSRKTFLITLLASDYLNGNTEDRVILFDTEMARFHTAKVAKRIHRLQDWEKNLNNDRLKVFSLRELSTEKRAEFVKIVIETERAGLVFIDGIRDLVSDPNNAEESTNLVNDLMRLSSVYDCHICGVLHENKASDTLRGHLGTETQNKSETVISVSKDGNISKVSAAYTRNIAFDDFHFRVNEDGLPEYCEPEIQQASDEKKQEKLSELFDKLLPATTYLSYSDLRTKVIQVTGKAQRTAERYIKDAVEAQTLTVNNANMYYSTNNNLLTVEDDNALPF